MTAPRVSTGGESAGRRSLRREWSRAFAIMLILLVVSAVATIVGVRGLVDQVRGTARQLHRESSTVDALSTVVVAHEEVGHKLLSDEPVDKAAFVAAQHAISAQFAAAVSVFPSSDGMKATVIQAEKSWQVGLTTYGLWGPQVQQLQGSHASENPIYGASSDATVAMLAGLEGPSLTAMNSGLSHAGDLETAVTALLGGLFALALGVTVYFRRRMIKDLLRPVINMHEGVLKLQGGEYAHRIPVARRDELGELTDAFNGMAGALHDSHLALTLRASHDSLTGLPNRATLTERLTSSFGSGADRRSAHESVLFIDVDDFKEVNDTLGHEGGDALLVQLAARLSACVRPQDMVARLGGDEFAVVVVEEGAGGAVAGQVAGRILTSLREPFIVTGTRLIVSVSIGAANRRPDTVDAAELLRSADFAMYMAKGAGKDRYQLFDAAVHDNMVGHTSLKADLAVAAASGQLRLDYQPVANLNTGHIVGIEALVRWHHPTRGLLSPAEFIPLAEETGDINAIGCWVLQTAARQAATWRKALPACADLWVAVNVSPHQLGEPHNVQALQRILADDSVDASHVVLEITETGLAVDLHAVTAALNTVKDLGARIAIDDFGCGSSSLSTLANLPVDILKIDRSFISGPTPLPTSSAMLGGILGLAEKLSLTVIAEGIEDADQLDLLRELGCTNGQGYFLGRPLAPNTLKNLLVSGTLPHVQASGAAVCATR